MNKIQKTQFLKDGFFILAFLFGAMAIFLSMDLEARILGAFLMAYGLTRFTYDSKIKRMEREINELKNE